MPPASMARGAAHLRQHCPAQLGAGGGHPGYPGVPLPVDSLLWPLLVVQSDEMKTIPLYITRYMAETHSDEGIMMAVAVLASLPMIILFLTLSKYFVSKEGLTSATKG